MTHDYHREKSHFMQMKCFNCMCMKNVTAAMKTSYPAGICAVGVCTSALHYNVHMQ
jgi:ribosomal protein S27E